VVKKNKKNNLIKILIGVVFFIIVFILFYNLKENPEIIYDELPKLADQYGTLSYLIFAAIVFIFTSIALPGLPVLALFAGILFGLKGLIPYVIGFTLGNLVPFTLSKYFFGEWFQKKFEKALNKFNTISKGEALWKYHLTVRVMPGPPSFAVSVFAGLNELEETHFILGTFIGCIPKTFLYILVGRMIEDYDKNMEYPIFFIIAMIILAVLSILPVLIRLVKNNKIKR